MTATPSKPSPKSSSQKAPDAPKASAGTGKKAGGEASPEPSARRPARPRAWQRMLSGRRLDLLDPSPLDVEIEDIAHGLARVARWNGQTSGAHIFSVAQHALLVERLARAAHHDIDRRWRLCVLLHDAPEYVIGDMISPFKAVIGGDYKAVEARLLDAISRRFSLPVPWPAQLLKMVKSADHASAYYEATRLAGFSEAEARRLFGAPIRLDAAVLEDYLSPWTADRAKARFLERFEELKS